MWFNSMFIEGGSRKACEGFGLLVPRGFVVKVHQPVTVVDFDFQQVQHGEPQGSPGVRK